MPLPEPKPLTPGCTVTCTVCEGSYTLSPFADYFDATNTIDGKCESCLLKIFRTQKQGVRSAPAEPWNFQKQGSD